MYDDILVPTDGGEQIDAVIEAAVDIAKQREATVHALSIIDSNVFLTLDEELTDAVNEELTANAEEAVAHVVDAAADDGVEGEAVIRQGRPSDEIIAYAKEIDADLIVMGTRRSDGHEHRMLGSVSQDVITEAGRQTLVVPLSD